LRFDTTCGRTDGTAPPAHESPSGAPGDQRRRAVDKLREELGSLEGKTVGLLGLAFKPNTDDMREAASVDIAHMLLAAGARVKAYDPVATGVAKGIEADDGYFLGSQAGCVGSFLVSNIQLAEVLVDPSHLFQMRSQGLLQSVSFARAQGSLEPSPQCQQLPEAN